MIGVCIVAYNEEKYIGQCIESALAQVCTEPVRVYVADDCSTDNTAEVCRQYADRIELIVRPKNLGLVGNTMALLDQIRKEGCEYIAMLDGDDYWTDDHKLQKQYDYLQSRPDYGLVHTGTDTLTPKRLKPDARKSVLEGNVFGKLNQAGISNVSVFFRTQLLDYIDFDEFQNQGFMSVDFVMYYIFSAHTKIGFIPDRTAVWRRGHDSVSNRQDVEKRIRYIQNDLAMWRYIVSIFPEKNDYTEENAKNYLHLCSFNAAFRLGARKRAIEEYKQMSIADQQRLRFKYLVAHSAVLTALWCMLKRIENEYI